jgi:ubiquitin carboxyl-terminal hydrolase 4/11/15
VSPAGNGLRLGGSSRNGSSSAFGAGSAAVVGALRGGGSDSAVGSRLRNGVAAGNIDDESPPHYDEGYADDDDIAGAYSTNLGDVYEPLNQLTSPHWSFSNVDRNREDGDSDVVAFDDDDRNHMAEVLGDEMSFPPGNSSPVGEMEHIAPVEIDDAELTEIHIKED